MDIITAHIEVSDDTSMDTVESKVRSILGKGLKNVDCNYSVDRAKSFYGRRDPYKTAQIDKILKAPEFYSYLSGDKTSGAKTINLDGDVIEIIKAFYEGNIITVERGLE